MTVFTIHYRPIHPQLFQPVIVGWNGEDGNGRLGRHERLGRHGELRRS